MAPIAIEMHLIPIAMEHATSSEFVLLIVVCGLVVKVSSYSCHYLQFSFITYSFCFSARLCPSGSHWRVSAIRLSWGSPDVVRGGMAHAKAKLRDKMWNLDYGPKQTKIFDEWLEDGESRKIVEEAWNQNVDGYRLDCVFRDKLKNVKFALKEWSKVTYGSIDVEIEDLKKKSIDWELKAENRALTNDEIDMWLDCRKKWIDKEKIITNMAKQKSRAKWIHDGDENSKYFHSMIKRRHSKRNIRGLNINGSWCEDPCEVKNAAFCHFKALFEKRSINKMKFGSLVNSVTNRTAAVNSFSNNSVRISPISATSICSNAADQNRTSPVTSELALLHQNQPCIIGNEQSAYLKGRFILDGALISNESIEYLKKNKRKSLIFKVDFEKAFDSLSWEFFLDMMETMGFGVRWRKWIHARLKSASISVLVNGSPTNKFLIKRGVRQGDPLSPFLFLIAAEGLNHLIKKACVENLFKGVEIGKDNIPLSHLQFADDTIFLGEWHRQNFCNLMKVLKCFENVSGLKINFHKSILYGLGVTNYEEETMARRFGCKVGELPFTYLGLPVGMNMSSVQNWNPDIEKINSKLANWKARRSHMVEGKWFWRAKTEPNSFWVIILKRIYGTNGLLPPLVLNETQGASSVWGNILRAGYMIEKLDIKFGTSFSRRIGNGVDTEFWNTPWLCDLPLKDKLKQLFHLDNEQDCSVRDRVRWIEQRVATTWNWRHPLNGRASSEYEFLLHILNTYVKHDIALDLWTWNMYLSGYFTTKKLASIIDEKLLSSRFNLEETLKNNLVSIKVSIFVWRVLKRRIPVHAEFDKRGIDIDSVRCPLCDDDVETIEHTLIFCRHAMDIKLAYVQFENNYMQLVAPDMMHWKGCNLRECEKKLALAFLSLDAQH
ncbi:uncharacterized protein [Rutidosis leptorrhynchoides]|uniref:uncharacterized protein n=1 Tax=Rutidosis leptorrhynchoides TaxID=125765 RepID=UPI003A98EF25